MGSFRYEIAAERAQIIQLGNRVFSACAAVEALIGVVIGGHD